MCIDEELLALDRIQWNNGTDGEISDFIICTCPGNLIFDVHSWELRINGDRYYSSWNEDVFDEKMIVLKFSNKKTFRKAYGLARLMRGRFRY